MLDVKMIEIRPPTPAPEAVEEQLLPLGPEARVRSTKARKIPAENPALVRSVAKGPAPPSVPPAGCERPLSGSVPTHAFLV